MEIGEILNYNLGRSKIFSIYKMIQHSANNRNFILVEVPKAAHNFEYYPAQGIEPPMIDFWKHEGHLGTGEIELPSGSHKILFLSDEATEEQAKEVVDLYKNDDRYCYYENGEKSKTHYCENAFYSFRSLVFSCYPLTPNRILILEKIS